MVIILYVFRLYHTSLPEAMIRRLADAKDEYLAQSFWWGGDGHRGRHAGHATKGVAYIFVCVFRFTLPGLSTLPPSTLCI